MPQDKPDQPATKPLGEMSLDELYAVAHKIHCARVDLRGKARAVKQFINKKEDEAGLDRKLKKFSPGERAALVEHATKQTVAPEGVPSEECVSQPGG